MSNVTNVFELIADHSVKQRRFEEAVRALSELDAHRKNSGDNPDATRIAIISRCEQDVDETGTAALVAGDALAGASPNSLAELRALATYATRADDMAVPDGWLLSVVKAIADSSGRLAS